MMRRIVIPTLVVAVLCLTAVQAQAGSAQSLLYYNEVNKLEDNDWEALVIGDTDTILEKGEVLVAMLEVQEVRNSDETLTNTPEYYTFTAILVVEVDGKTAATGGGWDYTFKPYTAANWSNIPGIGLPDHNGTGTMIMAYSDYRADPDNDKFTDVGTDTVPLSIKAALETAHLNNTTLLWEFGFTGTSPTSGAPVATSDEFYTTWARFDDISNPDLIIDIAVSLGTTYEAPGALHLLPHDHLYSGYYAEIQGQGGLGTGVRGAFPLVTDTDWYIKPTPEPGSIALLGLGLVACAGMVYRRRKNNA